MSHRKASQFTVIPSHRAPNSFTSSVQQKKLKKTTNNKNKIKSNLTTPGHRKEFAGCDLWLPVLQLKGNSHKFTNLKTDRGKTQSDTFLCTINNVLWILLTWVLCLGCAEKRCQNDKKKFHSFHCETTSFHTVPHVSYFHSSISVVSDVDSLCPLSSILISPCIKSRAQE